MTSEKLQEILRLHGMWLRFEEGGTRADLTRANLTDADLTRADLTRANLTRANLTRADLTRANLTDADLTRADLTRANLTDANLTRADLTRANLTRADLTRANLTDADLTRANLTDADTGLADLLSVPNLHGKIVSALDAGAGLEMGSWHLNDAACGTAHCRAGWYIHFAGPAGYMLERMIGPAGAGALIVAASCPYLKRVPDFYCSNDDEALADIKRCAEIEAKTGSEAAP
jgi:uncharacterized protein YjbI with pentapeptide repeats